MLRRKGAEHLENFTRQLRVEGAGRLVEEEHLWVKRQGPCDGNTLLLPAGELAGVGVFFICKAHFGEQRAGGFLRLLFLHTGDDLRLRDVFQHGEMREEVEILKNEAEF